MRVGEGALDPDVIVSCTRSLGNEGSTGSGDTGGGSAVFEFGRDRSGGRQAGTGLPLTR